MNWKNFTIITLDILLGVYLVLAITAFNNPDEETMVCNDVRISIRQTDIQGFLSKEDVTQMLSQHHIYPLGQPISSISARQIEEMLQGNSLIEHAECYKTQTGHVCIDIEQRVPVVRVMAQNGDDYYVDNHCKAMPITQYTCDVIVATGTITRAYAEKYLAPLANIILTDNFWKNQIVQLNVLNDGSVEIVPRVGEHIAYIGQPIGVERKFNRLRKFYRYGLNQVGWNKYARISVEFDNQIICKKNK